MCNLKEFNYCLRHHTQSTLKMFNLIDVTPRLKGKNPLDVFGSGYSYDDQYVYDQYNHWENSLEVHNWIGVVYMGNN